MKQELRNKDIGTTYQRYKKSFFHAIDGIIYAFKYEHNMIIILIATIVTILIGIMLKISIIEWLICILIIGMITATELINSSIEAVVDLETTKIHPLAKIAKDTASSATLILVIVSIIIGCIIFIPKIILYLWKVLK